jgi:putative membrane protein
MGPLEIIIIAIIIIFWVGVIWTASMFIRRGVLSRKDNPLEAAKERYAKGEIAKDEFDQIKKDLSS